MGGRQLSSTAATGPSPHHAIWVDRQASMSRATLIGLLPAALVPTLLVLAAPGVWLAVIGYHVLCVGAPLVMRQTFADVGLASRPSRRSLVGSLVVSAAIVILAAAVSQWPAATTLVPGAWRTLLRLLHPWWAFVAYSTCVNPILEEVFWRGFLLPYTGRIGGALLFYLMHVTALSVFIGPLAALWIALPTLLAGLAWGWMRKSSGSLWPCVITHLGADVAILIAAAALRYD